MDRFCGSQIWDLNITWYTSEPDFTDCFKKTVVVWTPLALLWLFSPLEYWYISRSLCRDIPRSWIYYCKLFATGSLLLISLFDAAFAVFQLTNDYKIYPVDFINPILKIFTLEHVMILIVYCRLYGLCRSGLLFWFWLCKIISGIILLRSEVLLITQSQNFVPSYSIISLSVYYFLVIVNFILTFFKEPMPKTINYSVSEKLCPVNFVSFPSLITFSWVDSIIFKGNKKSLEYNNLWDINYEMSSKYIIPTFDSYYNSKINGSRNRSTRVVIENCSPEDNFGRVNDNSDINSSFDPTYIKSEKSVLPALCKSFCSSFIFAMLLCLFQVVLSYVNPQILKHLIMFMNTSQLHNNEEWKGYFLSVCLFIVVMVQTFLSSQYFFRIFTIALKIRLCLTSVIYRKGLLLSSPSKKEQTVGQIVNLMAVDVNKCSDVLPFVNMVWAIPLRIILALFWLWKDLGYSVFAGLLVLMLLLPLQVYVATTNKHFQMKQMKHKDDRIKLMTEILTGFRALRFYAWEPFFEQKILKIRNKEIKYLKRTSYLLASMSFFWLCTPYLMALASFSCFLLSNEDNLLTPQVAFVCLSLFNLLQIPLALFPVMVGSLVQASVSLNRINDFLNSEELNEEDITHDLNEADVVIIENGTFSWGDELILKNINLRVPEGSLIAVVGTVGSGKSSLISALLGDVPKVSGHVNIKGRIAYVPQQAWIQNGTVRSNILFGRPYDKNLYDRVVEACALQQDFSQLPARDMTEISAKGINLSGGQKQRVSLARAVYSNADLYLMDDPLSAVDSQVGKFIFDRIIGPDGILANKTRLIVTQSVNNLHNFSRIIVLNGGEISEEGTFNDLLSRRGAFSLFILQYLTTPSDVIPNGNENYQKVKLSALDNSSSVVDDVPSVLTHPQFNPNSIRTPSSPHNSNQRINKSASLYHRPSVTIKNCDSQACSYFIKTPSVLDERSEPFVNSCEKIVDEEYTESGKVKLTVYKDYLQSMGATLVIVMLTLYTLYQVFLCGGNVWLSHYTGKHVSSTVFLIGYACFGVGQMFSVSISTLIIYLGALIASKTLHNAMLHNVFRLPMTFFNITPYGRILNRFSKDVDALDSILPVNLQGFIGIAFMVVGTLIIIGIFLPPFVLFIIPFIAIYFVVQRFYVTISRQLKRLESINRSPIYSHFEESLSGASSIRAYGVQKRFIEENHEIMERNIICIYPSIICDRWLQVRLETVGNIIIFLTAVCAVISHGSMAAGDIGLTITYALSITINLNMLVRNASMVETNIVGAERIKEYTKMTQEAAWNITPSPVSASWPERGEVQFHNYKFRYRDGLEFALKGVSFTINGGEKVGIVGRTGAGKSSLTMALFRVIEASSGAIYIDGIDISTVGLNTLRSRLTIIPQESILFSGTLRMNLDPGHQYKDKKLQQALEIAHLPGLTTQLDLMVMEGGENFSLGQRQLLCLARALLRKTKVLILDEATAAIDLHTEELIQETIRSQFADCTILTIAHRLKTILDSDRVLVLAEGKIVEFDSPTQLLQNKASVFYSLAKDAGVS
ncbi:multidrug resistance-associated protein 1-like [Lycorma delicatula]|uniref:multidrug resistance-associated protein 1-like n=1 Tax=Lycorma delicatula TaxID=130591 RepID=UPI003F5107EF